MKVLKKVLLILLIAIIALVVYYLINPNKAITLVFPDLNRITSFNTIIKQDSAHMKFAMVLQNKNPYKLNIDTVYFELKLSDTSLAHQIVPLNIKQSSFDSDTVKLPLDLHISQVMGLIKSLQKQDSTKLQIKGYIVYQTFFGRAKIKFDKTQTIEVPVPPKIKILKVERKAFKPKDKILKAVASIEIINGGKNLDLFLTNIHYNLEVKNTLHSSGLIAKSLSIKPQSSIVVDVPIDVEIFHPLKTMWLIGTDNDKVNYALHITCEIRENMSEKSFSSKAEVKATGMLELIK